MKKLLFSLLVVSMSSLYAGRIPEEEALLNVSTNSSHQNQEESSFERSQRDELLDSLEEALRSGELEDGGCAVVLVILIIAIDGAFS